MSLTFALNWPSFCMAPPFSLFFSCCSGYLSSVALFALFMRLSMSLTFALNWPSFCMAPPFGR
jgi:hypothetical protein